MEVVYTLNNGIKLSTNISMEYLEEVKNLKDIKIFRIKHNRKCKPFTKKIFSDTLGTYFVYNNQAIYLKDFDYIPAEKLVEKTNKMADSKEYELSINSFKNELLATLIKEPDKIAFICNLYPTCATIPGKKTVFNGKDKIQVLCKLSDKYYSSHFWEYKVSLVPTNAKYIHYFRKQEFYFIDFCEMLLRGQIRVVLKDSFIETQKRKSIFHKLFRKNILY